MSTIFTRLGKKRYVGGTVTEVNGKDISGATYTIGLSPDLNTLPTSFVTPDVNTAGATPAQRVLKLLISSPQAAGTGATSSTVPRSNRSFCKPVSSSADSLP